MNLGPEVNGPYWDGFPSISADGLRLFFSSGFPMGVYSPRPGGFGECDLWVTRRANKHEPWGKTVNLGPIVNTANDESTPSIFSDGSMLYFSSMIPYTGWNNMDLWQVEILPAVDFNGDGIVDAADVCIMVDHWGGNSSLCDIGPTPFGDGIVDVEDLIVLAEHLFEEIPLPFELVAYWKLDEAEGDIAYSSINDNHGVLGGNPIWQPDSGQVAGALLFDGIDDYVGTDFVLSPGEGPFSVFVWIKGGAPGQVVISQTDGANWFCTDSIDGYLITELKGTGRGAAELLSQTITTDDNWHRIGLVWDGSNRMLCVDGIVVAKDTQARFVGSFGGLYIGAGKNLEPTSFFSGLIDDVRIYNVALTEEEIEVLAH